MELPGQVMEAINRLEEAGFAAYAVGGCVRDRVLGMQPHDYDVCTAASPEEMKQVFAGERLIETGIRHGTVTVLLAGEPIEITAFRVDGAYQDGRHPSSVRFTKRVEDDLSRRDFTVNAMAYSPTRGLVDPFGGQADCERGLIRCVGKAKERFEEDALRILRALRFSARLGFPIEESTAAAIHEEKENLRRISRERVAAEMNGLLLGDHAGRLIKEFPDVIGEALACGGLPWPLAAKRVDHCPKDLAVRWAALLLDGPCAAESVLTMLRQPLALIHAAQALTANLALPGRASIRETMMALGAENTGRLLSLRKADQLARFPRQAEEANRAEAQGRAEMQRLLDEHACFTIRQLAVNGRDLTETGLQGKAVGETLEKLLLQVVREEAPNDRETLLRLAEKMRNGDC